MKGLPRRVHLELLSPAELAIREAVIVVEKLPADVRLTYAVVLLQQAREKVADYIDVRHAQAVPQTELVNLREQSNTEAAQEKAPELSESYRAFVKEMQINPSIFNRPMAEQMTKIEDAPTQTVAAPGPTAGDLVKRVANALHSADTPTATFEDFARAACDELLAQIREPDKAPFNAGVVAAEMAWHSNRLVGCPHYEKMDAALKAFCRALADKLTEAKPRASEFATKVAASGLGDT